MIRAMALPLLLVGVALWTPSEAQTPETKKPKVWVVGSMEKRFDPPKADDSPGDTYFFARATKSQMRSWSVDQLWMSGRVKEAELPTGDKVTYVQLTIVVRRSDELGLQKVEQDKVKVRYRSGSDSTRKWREITAPAKFSTQDSVPGVLMRLNLRPGEIQEIASGDKATIELSPGYMIELYEPAVRGLKGMAP